MSDFDFDKEFDEFEEKEYDDSLAGKFEETVDKVVEIRRSIFDGICDQIKSVANSVAGKSDDDEDFEPGPIARVVDTVSGVDRAIVDGTADIVKSIGRTVLGIF